MSSLHTGKNALTPWILEAVKLCLEYTASQEITLTRIRRPKMAQIIGVFGGGTSSVQQQQPMIENNVTMQTHSIAMCDKCPEFITLSDGKHSIGAFLSENALFVFKERGMNSINFSSIILDKWSMTTVITKSGMHAPFIQTQLSRLCIYIDEVRIVCGGGIGKSGMPNNIHSESVVRDSLQRVSEFDLKQQLKLAFKILDEHSDVSSSRNDDTPTKQALPPTLRESTCLDRNAMLLGAAKEFLGKESSQSSSSSSEILLSTQKSNTIQEYSQDQHLLPADLVGISEMITSTESNDISSSGSPKFKAIETQEHQARSQKQLAGSDQSENINNAKLLGFGLSQYTSSPDDNQSPDSMTNISSDGIRQNLVSTIPRKNNPDNSSQQSGNNSISSPTKTLTPSSLSTVSKRTIDQLSSQDQESVDLLAGLEKPTPTATKYASIVAAKQKPLWDPKCVDFTQASKRRRKDDDGFYVNDIAQDDSISKMKIDKYGLDLGLWLKFHVSKNSGRTKKKFGAKVKTEKFLDIENWLNEHTITRE